MNKRDPRYWCNPFDGEVHCPALSPEQKELLQERREGREELKHLVKFLEVLYTRRDRMLFCAGAMGEDSEAKRSAMAKLGKTKTWRGVNFDIECVERRIGQLHKLLGIED